MQQGHNHRAVLAVLKRTPAPGFSLEQVAEPRPAAGELLLRVAATSVCGTDVHLYDWNAWAAARDHIRVGGLWICDNAIKAGGMNVATGEDSRGLGWTDAVRRHNDAVMSDDRFAATILPIREGVMVALRTG